jgi:hypothetical protein
MKIDSIDPHAMIMLYNLDHALRRDQQQYTSIFGMSLY